MRHLLLNQESHSSAGIMRGDWNLKDLQDAVYGYLLFTPQQAEVLMDTGRSEDQPAEGSGGRCA